MSILSLDISKLVSPWSGSTYTVFFNFPSLFFHDPLRQNKIPRSYTNRRNLNSHHVDILQQSASKSIGTFSCFEHEKLRQRHTFSQRWTWRPLILVYFFSSFSRKQRWIIDLIYTKAERKKCDYAIVRPWGFNCMRNEKQLKKQTEH